MEQAVDTIRSFTDKDTWTYEEYQQLTELLSGMTDPTRKFRDVLADMEARNPSPKGTTALKIGIGRYMVCRFEAALEALADATDNKDRRFFAGQCHRSLRQWDKAAEEFQRAEAKGWEGDLATFYVSECLAMAGDLDEADKALASLRESSGETANTHYLTGLLAELKKEHHAAADAYEAARELEPGHPEATFRLAYYLDLHGEEEEAVELYNEVLNHPPVYANALMNLAVLHEDAGRYDQAIHCIRQILTVNPEHRRAKLFLKDAESSKNMFYDEDQARRIAKRNAVLDIPVTDFELSVRARNCLKKMNIRTLGDLVNTTESELLGYKNFGETSLKEIKDMLTAKGLRLGQAMEDEAEYTAGPSQGTPFPMKETPQEQGAGAIPVEQVEFSIRARRVLDQLGIRTMGELASRSEAELLSQKNFGQTSLNELRQKLHENGLDFRDND